MPNLIAFLAALALQAGGSIPAAPTGIPVFSECDASSQVVALVPRDAAIDVRYSIAGASTCYFVTLSAQGKIAVQGFVVDPELDAVVAFDRSRLENERIAFKAPVPVPVIASPVSAATVEPEKTAVAVKAPEKKPVVPKPRKDVSM